MVFVIGVLNWEFRMGFPSFLVFFVVSHLLLLHSAGEGCPASFDCGNHGKIRFPFATTAHPGCGLFTVNCSEPVRKINWGGGKEKWYEVDDDGPLDDYRPIRITDPELENGTESTDCNFSSYLNLQNTPSVSFTIVPNLTLFKCNTASPELKWISEVHFPGKQTYNGCHGYTFYYAYLSKEVPFQDPSEGNYPQNCEAIQLPVVSSAANRNLSDPFSLLAHEFSIEFHVSDECHDCYKGGGQCSRHPGEFQCIKGSRTNLALILGTVIPGVVLLLALLVLIIRYRNKLRNYSFPYIFWRNTSSDHSSKEDLEEGSVYFGVPVFSYTDLKIATHNFDPSKELGDGGFGIVYHGKLQDGREVAVKRLYEHNYKRVAQFLNEIEILTRLRHRNLVTLYGCTSRHSRELLLVYEYIPNGTVADHLHGDRAKDGSLAWPIRMNIAIETASALVYLHASEIIHRDVKTNNILLDNNFGVKVADFGLSRLFPNDISHVSTAPQGTPGYVDPDYHKCYQLTYKSDVYSFGVVLIELISSLPAVDIDRHRHEINLANLAINRIQNGAFNELIDPSLGFESDSSVERMTTSVAEVAFRCLQREKEMRPRMDEVLVALKDIQEYKDDDMGKRPPPSPDGDNVVLLKNSKEPPSPDSVTTPWISRSSISIASG